MCAINNNDDHQIMINKWNYSDVVWGGNRCGMENGKIRKEEKRRERDDREKAAGESSRWLV